MNSRIFTIGAKGIQPLVVPVYKLGRAVRYTGDMANQPGVGAIVAIRDTQPISYDVALTDGRQFCGTHLDGSRWQVADEHVAPDTVEILRAGVQARDAMDKANKSAAEKAFADTVAKIKAEHPELLQGDGPTVAAKNLRTELKRAFPSVAFSVRTSRYSGGDSIRISWTDGPTREQVECIANKYAGGHFDGMTDSYEYKRSPWTEVFGDARYVFCDRDYSDKMLESVISRVCNHLGGMESVPTAADYNRGELWKFKQSGGCDVEREIRQALARHTYCIAR